MLFGAHQHTRDSPRLLLIEHDEDTLLVMLEGMDRPCCTAARFTNGKDPHSCGGVCACTETGQAPCAQVIGSLQELHSVDLSQWDVIICGSSLRDGSGLDALAFVRGSRAELPVILTGPPGESAFAVEAIRAGASDYLLTTGGNLLTLPLAVEKCLAQQRIKHENERLQADLSRSLSETAVKNRQLQMLIQQLETMARTDELTGLCNRRWFSLMLERSWAEALRAGLPLAFAMMDLDEFKTINDSMGHQRGDELLRITGRVIQANSRQVDLPARYGGDEFCILMPNTEPGEAVKVMRRIAAAYQATMEGLVEGSGSLSMSVGISHIKLSRPANTDQLILHADNALYAAKSAGRGRIMVRESHAITGYETPAA